MGVFRGLESLSVTVESILQQTFTDFEIVIVDDGNCPADSALICETAKRDARIRVLRLDVNSGLTKALAKGCAESKGLYIARIDNGDLMVPATRLKHQYDTLETSKASLVSGGMMVVDLLNKDTYQSRKREAPWTRFGPNDPELKKIAHVTVMFRSEDYRAVGGYNEKSLTGQDSELWPRILTRGAGLLTGNIYAIAPMRVESISVAGNNKQIVGEIKREVSNLRTKKFRLRSVLSITLHLLKILIPLPIRVKLRYRKNYDYIGKYSSDDVSLAAIWTWYRESEAEQQVGDVI